MSPSELRQSGRKARRERRGAIEAPAAEASPPGSDPFPPAHSGNPLESAATIAAVTGDMMNQVAHKAAETADTIAHSPDLDHVALDHATLDHAALDHAALDPRPETAPTEAPAVPEESPASAATTADAMPEPEAMTTEAASAPPEPVAEATDTADAAAGNAMAGPAAALAQYNGKILEIIQANAAAASAFVTALMGVTSVPEAMALNADHLGRQMDAMTTQGRELASLAQKLAFEALQPLKATVVSRLRGR